MRTANNNALSPSNFKFENIMYSFDEICGNTKNKNKVNEFRFFKSIYISRVYSDLKNKTYKIGEFNVFYIYGPKKRRIVSQNMYDKLVNHLVSIYILYHSLLPCLVDSNCASREGKGTSYALKLYYKYRNILDHNYDSYYILK